MRLDSNTIKYTVSLNSTIEEAWSVIEENRHRSVIVVDNEKVVGTLSDGDIRKAMLKKRLFATPVHLVMNVNFTYVKKDEIDTCERLFRQKDIFLIPVVDDEMKLLDIIVEHHFLNDNQSQ